MRGPVCLLNSAFDVMPQQTKQTFLEALPAAAAIVTFLADIPIEKWAAAAGLGFILLQIVGYAWRLIRDIRQERERVMRADPPPPRRRKDLHREP